MEKEGKIEKKHLACLLHDLLGYPLSLMCMCIQNVKLLAKIEAEKSVT